MKRVHVVLPPEPHVGKNLVIPVLVNWFPGLTADEQIVNAIAHANGQPAQHPDPNMIEVVIEGLQ